VYDREGRIGIIQWCGWLIALGFLAGIAIFDRPGLESGGYTAAFLGLAWGGVAVLAAAVAGASLAGDRGRGFLDLVLMTPLTGAEVIDGTFLAIWEHLRRAFYLPLALTVVFCLIRTSSPIGAVCSVVTAALFLALVVLYGVGCSLCARSVTGGLAAAFVLPFTVVVGSAVLIGLFGNGHATVLWYWGLVYLCVGRVTRYSPNCWNVCCYLVGVHFALIFASPVWIIADPLSPAVATAHPGILAIVLMEPHFERALHPMPWLLVMASYCLMMAINFVWVRRWIIRHFDELAGRNSAAPGPSKLRAAGGPRERDDVADVGHAAQEQESALQP
jgi:hypothetical protein